MIRFPRSAFRMGSSNGKGRNNGGGFDAAGRVLVAS